MQQVKLTTSRVLASGQTQEFGDIITVPADEAAALIAAEQAQAVPAVTATPAQSQGRHSRK